MIATQTRTRSKVMWSVVGWLVVLVFFFPVLWMWLESLKTEPQAASSPPTILFIPTLTEFQEVLSGDFPPFFIISARFLPFAASLVPLYLLARDLHLLDNIVALVLIYTTINMPLGVWLLRSFLLEIPPELFEAARVDGASFGTEI